MNKKNKHKNQHINTVKTICPKCNEEHDVTITKYKTNKSKDGVVFTYKCLGCKDNFIIEAKYSEMQ